MMTEKEFDDILKKKLSSHESVVPGDMWQKIFLKKRRKRPVFWWFTLMFIFIGFATYSLLMINTPNETAHTMNANSVEKERNLKEKGNSDNATNLPDNPKKPVEKITGEIKIKSWDNSSNKQTPGASFTVSNSTLAHPKNDRINSNLNKTDSGSDVEIFNHQDKDSMQTKTINSNDTAQKNNDTQQQDESLTEKNEEQKDKWFIEVFASPAFPLNRIKSPDIIYESSLKKSLSTKVSFGFGGNICYQVNKRFAVKTGVYFTHINEQYSFRDTILAKTSVVKNHYNFVDVPLLVAINKEFASDLRASLTAGVVVNISSRYKGLIPAPFGGTLNIKKDDVYVSNIGAALFVSLSLSKQLTKTIDFYGEPYLRYQLKNMTTSLQTFDHKINVIGLSVGLRHYLF